MSGPTARTSSSPAPTGTDTVIGADSRPAEASTNTHAPAANTRQKSGVEEIRLYTPPSFAGGADGVRGRSICGQSRMGR